MYLTLWGMLHIIAWDTEWLIIVHHVAVPSQRLVILETAEVRQMPILVLGHRILPTEDNLHTDTKINN